MKRRDFIAALSILWTSPSLADSPIKISAVRIWPAEEFTRITLESVRELEFSFFLLNNPQRLVLDLHHVVLDNVLKTLPNNVAADDPHIQRLRAGQNAPEVVRLVVDLKDAVRPNIYTLAPVPPYGSRLVVDLYPTVPLDPLLAFLQSLPRDKNQPPDPRPLDEPAPVPKDKPTTRAPFTVVIDPGHGGEDSGAVGTQGTYEKNVVLAIAKELKILIDQTPNMRAALTRTADYFIPLQDRVRKARALKADLFVSIHADAFITPNAQGSSVFVLSDRGASSSAARWLANQENRSDLVGGFQPLGNDPNLARTLFDLSQSNTRLASGKFASGILSALKPINTLHRGEVESAAFAVLKAPDIPSILVETAFISNPQEERKLKDPVFQRQLAKAILDGITGPSNFALQKLNNQRLGSSN